VNVSLGELSWCAVVWHDGRLNSEMSSMRRGRNSKRAGTELLNGLQVRACRLHQQAVPMITKRALSCFTCTAVRRIFFSIKRATPPFHSFETEQISSASGCRQPSTWLEHKSGDLGKVVSVLPSFRSITST
jgi:hypothetical protein